MSSRRFDDCLTQLRSDDFKRIARLWGAGSQCRKDECLAIIRRGLNEPSRAQAAVKSLGPYELNALALAKQMGGEVESGALALALRASGDSLPSSRYSGDGDTTLILPLIRRGLFLTRNTYDPASLSSSYGSNVIFADERLLAHVGPPKVKPLALQPTTPPSSSTFRPPQTVTLDIIGILQAIHDLGGLHLTQAGTVRVNDARKLARAMGWREEGLQVDGLTLPDTTGAFAAILLHSGLLTREGSAPSPQTAWIVQPNFDVVVYLDRVTPPQGAFLERHAERVNAQQHIAHYRLTRESVYRRLEAGTELRDLLADLQAGAGAPLPPNVVTEIREWRALRERMTLRRRARLLEFPDEQARRSALERGLEGVPAAERFVLLNGKLDPSEVAETVDYAKPLERCLAITEDGVIRLKQPPRDLLIGAQLARWAERTLDGKWQLTASSVGAAVKAGRRREDLLILLQGRLTHLFPPLLAVALRAWSGETLPVELAPVTILRCSHPELFAAIVHSGRFRPCLRGQLAPDVPIVDAERLSGLREALAWVGLSVSKDLVVEPLRAS
ncbi:MAG: helicase-associated domain-containing protein [Chloroflexi bacterium]|nr:helicase-associated domain-containing protein [Chloroflexota bacterium]